MPTAAGQSSKPGTSIVRVTDRVTFPIDRYPFPAADPMIPRIRTIALITAAAGGPYVATETEMGRDAVSTASQSLFSAGDSGAAKLTGVSAESSEYGSHAHHQIEKLRQENPNRYRYDRQLVEKLGGEYNDSLVGTQVKDIREVLRFDITPEWVTNRFSRVGTVLADLQLEGLRVPVVSGTRADDVAGTLTYYFDHSRKLQRVMVHGFTGDPTRLVNTMTQHYGLAHEPTLEAGVFTRRWNGRPVHFLRLTRAPVVHADAVHQKYTVFLELNQPDLAFGISPEAQRIVHADRWSGRW